MGVNFAAFIFIVMTHWQLSQSKVSILNEDLIRTLVGDQNFDLGLSYYRQGAVRDTFHQGDILSAAVEGSQYEPYTVQVILLRVESVYCTFLPVCGRNRHM